MNEGHLVGINKQFIDLPWNLDLLIKRVFSSDTLKRLNINLPYDPAILL